MVVKIVEQRMTSPSLIHWVLRLRRSLFGRAPLLDNPIYVTPANLPANYESTYSVTLKRSGMSGSITGLENFDFWNPWVVRSQKSSSLKRTIIYYHGGGFTSRPLSAHWILVASLAERLDAEVVMQPYLLTPHADVHDNVDTLVRLYEAVTEVARQQKHEIILGGDSAGGGVTATMLLALNDRKIPLPNQAFFVSAVWDCDIDQPDTTALEGDDGMLTVSTLAPGFKNWASRPGKSGTDSDYDADALAHPYASPIHGDWSFAAKAGLKMTVLAGGWDILFAQSERFVQRCQNIEGVNLTYIRADKASHVWPLFAGLPLSDYLAPDSKQALNALVATIVENSQTSASAT